MVDIESKRGHKVSVLLTPDIKGAMDILVKKRQEANINTNNKFFFARPSEDSLNHIRHWDCLRKQCTGLKLKQPDLITSTHLRKYVATVSQVLDLQEKELDWLARHMGHDIRVHREYYRLHESTLELAKVSMSMASLLFWCQFCGSYNHLAECFSTEVNSSEAFRDSTRVSCKSVLSGLG